MPLSLAAGLLLAGCIEAPVTASGSGVVTVSWAGEASGFDGAYGNVLALCSASAPACGPAAPGSMLFSYLPADLSTSAQLEPGVPVTDAAGGSTGLPAGRYTLQALLYRPEAPDSDVPAAFTVGDLLSVVVGNPTDRDLTVWLQSLPRGAATDACPRGYTPSWDRWPNEGAGGFVCNRSVYAYYPDEPVRPTASAVPGQPWLWSVSRADADAPCPDGYEPSWAEWPAHGTGGYVCNGAAGEPSPLP